MHRRSLGWRTANDRLRLLVLSPLSRERRFFMLDILYGQLQFIEAVFVLLALLAMLIKHERKLKRWLLKR